VANLPDVKTESDQAVELPGFLIAKWKAQGKYEKEMASLDAFFKRTGYPRAPRYYIIKWLTDYIAEFGIDGYRADTVKHTDETVWADFKTQCDYAFAEWKKTTPRKYSTATNFTRLQKCTITAFRAADCLILAIRKSIITRMGLII
jgi:alpha-amylase